MKFDNEQSKIDLMTERLKLWSDALNMLAQPEMAAQLITVLEAGDRKSFEALLVPTRLFQIGGCIDIVDTITHVVNFGAGHFEERCNVAPAIATHPLSETEGKIYKLPDGTFVLISERLWAEYATRAQQDAVWREQNKEFLKAIGVLIRCSWVWVSDSTIVTVKKTGTICFPTVIIR